MPETRGYRRWRDDPAYLAERQQFHQDMRTRLRALRLHLGLTEREMAARLEISVRAYRHRERRAVRMSWLFSIRLAEEFNVSLDWLTTGSAGGLPRNDRRPLDPDMRAIPPALRVVAPFPGRGVVLTEPLDILFMQWVRTLPLELLPDLARALQALAERRPAQKAHAAMLKFLHAAGYPDAERRAADWVRSGLRGVGCHTDREGA
jgi:transcriptional regulator with XRE-family HTH domain